MYAICLFIKHHYCLCFVQSGNSINFLLKLCFHLGEVCVGVLTENHQWIEDRGCGCIGCCCEGCLSESQGGQPIFKRMLGTLCDAHALMFWRHVSRIDTLVEYTYSKSSTMLWKEIEYSTFHLRVYNTTKLLWSCSMLWLLFFIFYFLQNRQATK